MSIAKRRVIRKTSVLATASTLIFIGGITHAHAAPAATCDGLSATIVSSARIITGTARDDVIIVQGKGKHLVTSGDGNDTICGSVGNDTINSGNGNDKVISGAGDDVITSGEGNDNVSSGTGNDSVRAGIGNDTINSGIGDDSVDAGTGNDSIDGGLGNDLLKGSAGKDRIAAGGGNDTISGGDGDDHLNGQAGIDAIKGDAGNDTLQGGTGRDVLTPGAGDNVCASDQGDAIVGACQIDAEKPTKPDVNIISPIAAGGALTVMWSVRDLSGIDSSMMFIGGASGWVTDWCGFGVAGSPMDGSGQAFMASCTIPTTAVNGTYTVFVWAVDAFGNRSEDAQAYFEVINGVSDSAAPVISNIQVNGPATYGKPVTITWRATDESGVAGVNPWLMSDSNGFGFANAQGMAYADYGTYDVTLINGDTQDGTYQSTIKFNDFAPTGDYTIWMGARDIYGNRSFSSSGVIVKLTS